MVIRIVTDSGADLSEEIVKDLNITVVPLHVLFGDKDYLDEVDITKEELYQRLVQGPIHPTTSTAAPGEFIEVFRKLAAEGADGIICISITGKLSKTYGSAVQGKDIFEASQGKTCKVAVIDSQAITMGIGLLVILAAKLVKEGKEFDSIVSAVQENISRIHTIGALDTLKYLVKGGRAPRVALVAGPLKIKTFVKVVDGELHLMGAVRTQQKKTEKLIDFVRQFPKDNLAAVAVEYSTDQPEAQSLKDKIEKMFPKTPIYLARVGAALGVHGGPGTIIINVETKK